MTTKTTYAELTPGQLIWGAGERPLEVLHVVPITTYPGDFVRLVYADGETTRERGGDPARLVSDAERDQAEQDARRRRLVDALCALSAEIEQHRLPIPRYSLHIGGCVDTFEDVQRWAAHLGVEIEAGGTAGDIPVAKLERRIGAGPSSLHISFQGPTFVFPKDDETAAGVDTASADAAGEGVSSMAPVRAAAAPSAVGAGEGATADGVTPDADSVDRQCRELTDAADRAVARRMRGVEAGDAAAVRDADQTLNIVCDALDALDENDESSMVRTRFGYASDMD